MGVYHPSVSGKRFSHSRHVVSSRVFSRRRPYAALDVLFLLVLLIAAAFIAADMRRYFSSVPDDDTSEDVVLIDLDKGVPIHMSANVESREGEAEEDEGEWGGKEVKFTDASLEKGERGVTYAELDARGRGAVRPIPLPPSDAPVLFPSAVDGVEQTEATVRERRYLALQKRRAGGEKRNQKRNIRQSGRKTVRDRVGLTTNERGVGGGGAEGGVKNGSGDDGNIPDTESANDDEDKNDKTKKSYTSLTGLQTFLHGKGDNSEAGVDGLSLPQNPSSKHGQDDVRAAADSQEQELFSVSNKPLLTGVEYVEQVEGPQKPASGVHAQENQSSFVVWDPPFQPILESSHRLSMQDLQQVFKVVPTHTTLVHEKHLPLLDGYDIRNDAEYQRMALRGDLEVLHRRYAPIARQTWSGLMGNTSTLIPSDLLYLVRHSGNKTKGYAAYACMDLPTKTVLGVYGGELRKLHDAGFGTYAWSTPDMMVRNEDSGQFESTEFVVDALNVGSFLRFVNDLGKDNANVMPVWVPLDNRWLLFYESIRPIRSGEELSVFYGSVYWLPS